MIMAFWSKKRLDDKLIQYFNDKGISYEIETEEAQRFKFELCFQEGGFILYPYITVDEELISFNVNVSQPGLKGFNYEKLNGFNAQSKFFKAYLTDTGIICLEYRFLNTEGISLILDSLVDSLFALTKEIDQL